MLNAMLTQTSDNIDWVLPLYDRHPGDCHMLQMRLFGLHAEYFSREELLHRLSAWGFVCIMM